MFDVYHFPCPLPSKEYVGKEGCAVNWHGCWEAVGESMP